MLRTTQTSSLPRALLPLATVTSVPPGQSYNISLTHVCAHTLIYSHTTASYTQLHTHTYIQSQSHTLTCSYHINIDLYTHRWHTHIHILTLTHTVTDKDTHTLSASSLAPSVKSALAFITYNVINYTGLAKKFGFFHTMSEKNPNKLSDQPNIMSHPGNFQSSLL